MSTPYNLDDGVTEYFEFILKGNLYRFRYPTTREIQELSDEKDDKIMKDFITKFISKVEDSSPEFSEIVEDLTIPHWRRFRVMMEKEMSANGKNTSTEDSETPSKS